MPKIFLFLFVILVPSTLFADVSKSVSFESPKDGAQVPATVKFQMVVTGMAVAPAGEFKENTGHHHILIDMPCVPEGEIVGTGEGIHHFGKGQTDAELTLPYGTHTVTLQFANGAHASYGPSMCSTITLHVSEG